MVMSREDIDLAGLPVGAGGLDILAYFLCFVNFLFVERLARKYEKRAKRKKENGREEKNSD